MAKLANFEVTFELKELKIHVKGDREIAPSIANNVGKHFGQVLSPAGLIEAPKNGNEPQPKVIEAEVSAPKGKKKKSGKSANIGETAVSWTHDAARWGTPVQSWKAVQKAAWLLYVVNEAANKRDLSAGEISETFNAHFRDAGPPRASNIARDLGKEPTLFGEQNGRYFLKQEGKEMVERLIAEAKGGTKAA
jgi:hypothetical protein